MSSSAYSTKPSDILDERVDSSSLLIQRLSNWRHAVSIVLEYAEQQLSTQNSTTSHLNRQRKVISNVPTFSGASIQGGSKSEYSSVSDGVTGDHATAPSTVTSATGASSASGIHRTFATLAQQTEYLIQESESVSQSIKASVIPGLELLLNDLEKHQKTLKSQGQKSVKEIEKLREETTKYLEQLGRSVSVAGVQRPDPKTDPYVLHRKVRSTAAEQIWRENHFAESNLNVQHNFESLEQHVVEVIQNSMGQLDELAQRYYRAGSSASSSITRSFSEVSPKSEWSHFISSNQAHLVPETGYQRDPSKVSFANSDQESTKPLMEGVLNRKGTVLKGQKQGYYVLTPSGFLHEYKSSDYVEDPQPELSLYIPDSEIGGLPQRASGDLSFKIASRDSNRMISTRHKYTFTAASYDELSAWYQALSRVAGATDATGLEDDDSTEYPVGAGAGAASVPATHGAHATSADAAPGTSSSPTYGTPPTTHSGPTSAYPQERSVATGADYPTAGYSSPGHTSQYGTPNIGSTEGNFSTPPTSHTGGATGIGAATTGGVAGAGATGAASALHGHDSAAQPTRGLDSTIGSQKHHVPSSQLGSNANDALDDVHNKSSHAYSTFADPSGKGAAHGASGLGIDADPHNNSKLASNPIHSAQDDISSYTHIPSGNGPEHGYSEHGYSGLNTSTQGKAPLSSTLDSPYSDRSTKANDTLSPFGASSTNAKGSNSKNIDVNEPKFTDAHGSAESGQPHLYETTRNVNEGHHTVGGGVSTSPSRDQSSHIGATGKQHETSKSTSSNIPRYHINPSHQNALRSDNVDGLGQASTFGAIPVNRSAENDANLTREHDADIGVLDDEGRYNWKHGDIHHPGIHRHDPSQGLADSHHDEYDERTPKLESTTNTKYPESQPKTKSTTVTVPSTTTTTTAPTAPVALKEESKPRNEFESIKPKDVPYSLPSESGASAIAAGNTNPLLGSETSYGAPSAQGSAAGITENDAIKPKDTQYSYPNETKVNTIAASNANPLLGSKTAYGAPSAQGSGFGETITDPRDDQQEFKDASYSLPNEHNVSNIAAGNTNPLLGSETRYRAPGGTSSNHPNYGFFKEGGDIGSASHNKDTVGYGAPSNQGSNYGVTIQDSNDKLRSHHASALRNKESAGKGSAGLSDLGSKSKQEEQFYDPSQNSPSSAYGGSNVSKHGHSSSIVGTDTHSRLDPLSSSYKDASSELPAGAAAGAAAGTGSTLAASPRHGQDHSVHGHDNFEDARSGPIGSSAAYNTSNHHGQTKPQHQTLDPHAHGHRVGATQSDYKTKSGAGYDDFGDRSRSQFIDHDNLQQKHAGANHVPETASPYSGEKAGSYHTSNLSGSNTADGSSKVTGSNHSKAAVAGGAGAAGVGAAGVGAAGAGTGSGSGASGAASGAGASGTGASGAAGADKAGASSDSKAQKDPSYRDYSPDKHKADFFKQAGNYSNKDYSHIGPDKHAGSAKAHHSGGGNHPHVGAVAGGIGALGGLAAASGIPGADVIGRVGGVVGQIGNNGIGNAAVSQIPGHGEYNQFKQALDGNIPGAVKNDIPGANQAQQLNNSYKDIKGGNAGSKLESSAENKASSEVEKETGKKSGLKKLANVFKSS